MEKNNNTFNKSCYIQGTLILLANGGTKAVEKLLVGDILLGDDSTIRIVETTTKSKGKLYNIEQSDGINYTVNKEHTLSLKSCWTSKIINITVDDYLDKTTDEFKKEYKGYRNVINEYPTFIGENKYDKKKDVGDLQQLSYDSGFNLYGWDRVRYLSIGVRIHLLVGILERFGVFKTLNQKEKFTSHESSVIAIYIFSHNKEILNKERLKNLVRSVGLTYREIFIPEDLKNKLTSELLENVVYKHDGVADTMLLIYGNELNYLPWVKFSEVYKSINSGFDPYERLSSIKITEVNISDFYGFTLVPHVGNKLYMLPDCTIVSS
jgi:hypothetical protein